MVFPMCPYFQNRSVVNSDVIGSAVLGDEGETIRTAPLLIAPLLTVGAGVVVIGVSIPTAGSIPRSSKARSAAIRVVFSTAWPRVIGFVDCVFGETPETTVTGVAEDCVCTGID